MQAIIEALTVLESRKRDIDAAISSLRKICDNVEGDLPSEPLRVGPSLNKQMEAVIRKTADKAFRKVRGPYKKKGDTSGRMDTKAKEMKNAGKRGEFSSIVREVCRVLPQPFCVADVAGVIRKDHPGLLEKRQSGALAAQLICMAQSGELLRNPRTEEAGSVSTYQRGKMKAPNGAEMNDKERAYRELAAGVKRPNQPE